VLDPLGSGWIVTTIPKSPWHHADGSAVMQRVASISCASRLSLVTEPAMLLLALRSATQPAGRAAWQGERAAHPLAGGARPTPGRYPQMANPAIWEVLLDPPGRS